METKNVTPKCVWIVENIADQVIKVFYSKQNAEKWMTEENRRPEVRDYWRLSIVRYNISDA